MLSVVMTKSVHFLEVEKIAIYSIYLESKRTKVDDNL